MEIGVGGEEEQVGAVGPGHGVEDQLPRALWHLGSIFGQQPTPLSERLQREQRERDGEKKTPEEVELRIK